MIGAGALPPIRSSSCGETVRRCLAPELIHFFGGGNSLTDRTFAVPQTASRRGIPFLTGFTTILPFRQPDIEHLPPDAVHAVDHSLEHVQKENIAPYLGIAPRREIGVAHRQCCTLALREADTVFAAFYRWRNEPGSRALKAPSAPPARSHPRIPERSGLPPPLHTAEDSCGYSWPCAP